MNSDIHHFIELLWGMTEKELHARYKYTIFGFLWLVVNPLLQMIVVGFIFTFLMKEPVKNYYYYLFTGLLVWNFFSLSLTKATPSIVHQRALIKKAPFPRAVIPLSIVASNFINFIAAFLLFLIPVWFLGTMNAASIVYLAIAMVLLILFTVGITLLTSALNVRYRDVNFFVQAVIIVWFYATPIIYSFMQIPRGILWIWRFNPLTSVLQLYQHALIKAPLPGPAMMTANIIEIVIISALGIYLFYKESKTFDDWV